MGEDDQTGRTTSGRQRGLLNVEFAAGKVLFHRPRWRLRGGQAFLPRAAGIRSTDPALPLLPVLPAVTWVDAPTWVSLRPVSTVGGLCLLF